MKKPKPRSNRFRTLFLVIPGIVCVLFLAIYKIQPSIAPLHSSPKITVDVNEEPPPLPTPLASRSSLNNKGIKTDFYKKYFQDVLLNSPEVEKTYELAHQLYSNTPAGELISIYAAEVPARSDRQEFAIFLDQLRQELRLRSKEIYKELIDHEDQLKTTSFFYQNALNLVPELDLSPKEKARFLGKALDQKFEIDENNNISVQTASITIALIQMKRAGITTQIAKEYIQKGIEKNQNDPKALEEFTARVKAYFPENF